MTWFPTQRAVGTWRGLLADEHGAAHCSMRIACGFETLGQWMSSFSYKLCLFGPTIFAALKSYGCQSYTSFSRVETPPQRCLKAGLRVYRHSQRAPRAPPESYRAACAIREPSTPPGSQRGRQSFSIAARVTSRVMARVAQVMGLSRTYQYARPR